MKLKAHAFFLVLVTGIDYFQRYSVCVHLFSDCSLRIYLVYLNRNSFKLDSYLDPAFMSIIKDPDLRRKEQWEKSAQANKGLNLANMLGFGDLGSPPLSAAEEYSLHSRYLAKANSMNLSDVAEMKIM